MAEDSEVTPVNGIAILIAEVRALKAQCQQIADNGLLQSQEIPKLRKEIRNIRTFQAWFPTMAITGAIIFRLLFLR